MKLSTKIILPIIIISALLILLNGCMGTVPDDESPGFTPGTITGIIASPCCSTSAEPVSETCCIAPEYWCFWCQQTWSLQDGIEVVLTYGEDEVATVFTNEDGEFTFTNVDPGKNYVVTAYCPDFADNRPLVKDVALELIEGGSFDTKITDLVSTSFGLVVDFLVLYTELGPEDIILEGVIADKPNFPNFPKFKKLVYEVRRVLENCEVNMLTDDDLQDALCLASEEVGRETDPDLVIGCSPGYTPPPPPPPPDPCAGNDAPVVNKVEYSDDGVNFTEIFKGTTIHVISGGSYTVRADVSDDDIKDPLTFQPFLDTVELGIYPYPGINVGLDIPLGDWSIGSHSLSVEFYDGCTKTPWPVTVVVGCPVLEAAVIDIDTIGPLCQDECATISSVTVTHADGTSVIAYNSDDLTWTVPAGISFDPTSSDQVCLTEDPVLGGKAYTIEVTYTDECGEIVAGSVDVTFELCCPVLEAAVIDIDTIGPLCQDECATISSVTVTHADGTSVIAYNSDDLTWTVPAGISFDPTSSDQVCLTEDPVLGGKAYTIEVTYTDECGEIVAGSVDVTFELCCPVLEAAVIDIDTIGPLCQDECATISSVTVTHADGTSVIAYNSDDLTWTVPAGISFDPTSSDQVCLTEDPVLGGKAYTIEVTYTDECGEIVAGSVDVTFELCCPVLEAAVIDIDTIGPLCQDECATISSVTVTHADGTSVIAYNSDDLTWTVPAGISFDPTSSDQVCLTEDPVLGGKAYTIEVTYTDECGETVAGSVDVTFELCFDNCFVLNVKLGGVTHTYTQDYFGGVLLPGEIYVVDEDFSNASKFHFMFNCPPGSLEYNYYRGLKCGGSWESGEKPLTQPDSSAPPPVWLTDPQLKNGAFYPAMLPWGLLLCQKGGNILKIRVNGDDDLVFTFELGRNLP